jgi:hypothetical protein
MSDGVNQRYNLRRFPNLRSWPIAHGQVYGLGMPLRETRRISANLLYGFWSSARLSQAYFGTTSL